MGFLSDLRRKRWNFNNKLLLHCGLHQVPQRKKAGDEEGGENEGDEEGGENDIFNTPVMPVIIALVARGLEL